MKLLLALFVVALAFAANIFAATPGKLRQTGSGWPACAPGQRQLSGYFDINSTENKHYFYWAVESKKPSSKKLVLWLTGGPGCSSTLALLAENGPCHINETTGDLYANPYAWSNDATVIWLDQPAGVGYSYSSASGQDSNEKEVGFDNNAFMQHFLAANPSMQDYEFFVVGESYGGHYAPATASAIFNANKAGTNAIKVNLVGLATGNGLVAPEIQYQYYERMATVGCQQDRADKQSCVSSFSAYMMNESIPSCVDYCKKCDQGDALACDLGRGTCNEGQIAPYSETGLNPYDVTIKCQYPPLCYNFKQATDFLNRADVKAALGAEANIEWASCNFQVNQDFAADWLHRYDLLIPPMLEAGIRYLNYAGDYDFICNWMGNQAVALELPWSGKAAFNNAPFRMWTVDGQEIAQVRSVSSQNSPIHMNFVKVHKAGHMVPMDQPKTAGLMINAFINNRPFM